MKVWVIFGNTESGDTVGPYVFGHKPSRKEAHEHIRHDWAGEYAAFGPDGGMSLEWVETTVNE